MQENRVSIKISAEDIQKINDAINIINTTLAPYLIALTPEQRQTLPKMSDGSLPFVQKAFEYALDNPSFVPSYIDINELKTDVDATVVLLQFERPLEQLMHSLSDTIMLAGSEAYVVALAFYNSVKQAAKMKVPGAEAIVEALKPRFETQGKRSIKPAA